MFAGAGLGGLEGQKITSAGLLLPNIFPRKWGCAYLGQCG